MKLDEITGATTPSPPFSLLIGWPLLALEALGVLHLLRHVRALHFKTNCLGRPHTKLPPERLRARLRYLVAKYADHAPYWQFVLFARQIAAAAIGQAARESALLQAGGTACLLGFSLALHVRTQPYAHRYQNRLESMLATSTLLFICGGCAYHTAEAPAAKTTVDASLLVVMLAPLAVPAAWVAATLGVRHEPSEARRAPLLESGDGEHEGVVPRPGTRGSVQAAPEAGEEHQGGGRGGGDGGEQLSAEERLRELRRLHDAGLIEQYAFEERQREILATV